MCVIIVKKRGIKMPSKEILKACAQTNHDGFGFVSERDYFRSLNFDEFYKRLKNVPKDQNCIIHMRWATHGSVKVENCHPFNIKGYFMAHNGILDIMPNDDMTDSETAFREILYPCMARFGYDSTTFEKTADLCKGSSKFAFMHNGEVKTFGKYNTIDGIMYSNLNWTRNYHKDREYIPFAYYGY